MAVEILDVCAPRLAGPNVVVGAEKVPLVLTKTGLPDEIDPDAVPDIVPPAAAAVV